MLLLPIIIWWAKSPMRFSIGRSRQLICLLSLWAVTAAALPTTRNVIASEPVLSAQGDGDVATATIVREGTAIPPTQGRVAMLGRRWAFVPDQGTLLHKQLIGESPNDVSSDKLGKRSRSLRIVSKAKLARKTERAHVAPSGTFRVNRMMGPVILVKSPNRLVSSKSIVSSSEKRKADSTPTGQLVLAENLMLQRIVASIRSDLSDDRWILSGTINEFFGENRMVIRSAQRGNAE